MKKRILKYFSFRNLTESNYEVRDIKLSESEVWLKAWCSVANAVNCESVEVATRWADNCLKDYKTRFDNKK